MSPRKMHYTFMPSLKYITLVKTAVMLWNDDDTTALTSKYLFWALRVAKRRDEWQVIEGKVREKVPALMLPEELKEGVMNFIAPIGEEMLKWRQFHEYHLCERRFIRKCLGRLCWTPQGAVDRKRTAEILIKDENFAVHSRYSLACMYCLEQDIAKLWDLMPEDRQKELYVEGDPSKVHHQELVVLWTYHTRGEGDELEKMIEERCGEKCSTNAYAFERAVHDGIQSAADYFLQKLTLVEKEELLATSVGVAARRFCFWDVYHPDLPMGNYTDVIRILLSQMSGDQEKEVFERHQKEVLRCFLEWPWHRLFMGIVNRMPVFPPEDICYLLLEVMADKLIKGRQDYEYRRIFGEFWTKIPPSHKKYIIEERDVEHLLSKLRLAGDKDNVGLVLKDVTSLKSEILAELKLETLKL